MTDDEYRSLLTGRIASLEERVRRACERSGRPREAVTVVAVTKTVPANVARLLIDLGLSDMGESRPQVLWEKAAELPATVRWHQIGHLQRNKADRTVPLVHRVHSCDTEKLLRTLADESVKQRTNPLPVLLEVNVSREEAKHGFAPEAVAGLPLELLTHPNLRVDGLMCMAAYSEDPEDARPAFGELRRLRDRLESEWGLRLPHLSMGMSGDFEVGIEEGATFVRPGSVLFEGI